MYSFFEIISVAFAQKRFLKDFKNCKRGMHAKDAGIYLSQWLDNTTLPVINPATTTWLMFKGEPFLPGWLLLILFTSFPTKCVFLHVYFTTQRGGCLGLCGGIWSFLLFVTFRELRTHFLMTPRQKSLCFKTKKCAHISAFLGVFMWIT